MQTARTRGGDPLAAQLVGILMHLQALHRDMTILQARMFFAIASAPGCTQRSMLEALGGSDSALSRVMAVLSDTVPKEGRAGGLGLVEYKENPLDRREKLMRLSPKGKQLWEEITQDLERWQGHNQHIGTV
jgi:DNA-binding MarR family transcriptional regulator